MAVMKNAFPILEYDPEQRAVLMPDRKHLYTFPRKAVISFDDIDDFVNENNCEEIGEHITCTKRFPIYKAAWNGSEVLLCHVPLGASAAVQLLDFIIGYGAKEIIAVGSCGTLIDLPENHFIIPTEALRDEGVSYHYLPPSRTVELNSAVVSAVKEALEAKSYKYTLCKTWTTDGFYRSTIDMINHRKEEGCAVVEMECAGLAACAQFRGAVFGQLLYTADTLADVNEYDARDWGKASERIALELALDSVIKIKRNDQ